MNRPVFVTFVKGNGDHVVVSAYDIIAIEQQGVTGRLHLRGGITWGLANYTAAVTDLSQART